MAYSISNAYVSLTKAGWSGISLGGIYLDRSGGGGTALPASQQQFPTSAYGQVVPVIWGKARVPGGYIWAPDIIVKTTTTGAVLQTTTVKVLLSARIRFAAPLVRDSTWQLRRLWQDGTLIVDNSRGYKKSGFNYRFYDGRSTQGRDPHMVSKEGTANVSAHRGYIDIVIQNYNLGAAATAPPSFEAELVQDDVGGIDVDVTTGFFSDAIDTFAAGDWENGIWYGTMGSPDYLRAFDIGANQEIYALPVTGLTGFSMNGGGLRYVPSIDRLIIGQIFITIGTNVVPTLLDPQTGGVIALGETIGDILNTACVVSFGSVGCYVSAAFSEGQIAIHRFTATEITRTYFSGFTWDGRAEIQCIAPGEIRASEADVYLCGDTKLYKAVVSSSGLFTTITDLYTAADNLVYCVYHEGNVLVWNDSDDIISIDAETGAVNFTETVPYQIGSSAATSSLAPPDLHRLDGVIMVETTGTYYFTNLETGETDSESKTSASVGKQVYDGIGNVSINTDRGIEIARRALFQVVGDGDLRDLEDFIGAVWERTGFDASEHVEQNIDDQIQGAVIDITSGGREIVRSTAEPYSFAIWERDGAIRTKRALTDGSFAVDVTISATDIADAGGQAIRARRLNPEEFIARYGINHRDPDQVYQAVPQWGEIPSLPLPVSPTDIGVKADIPIIMDGDTIKILATKKVNRIAVEKHEFELRLKAKYADLEPEDIIQFTFANRTVTARIFETTLNPDLTISVTCTEFLSSVAVTISGGTGRPVEPEPVGTALSRYHHLDIPLLEDIHDTDGGSLVQYHVLASGGQPYWDGATLYRKDGSTYLPQVQQAEDGLVGILLDELPDWDIPYVTEFTREITIAVVSGDTDLLTSATYQEVCEGANMFAIGQPGRWEVCHVIDITDNGDNTYTFTGLRRGRGTSEEFTGLHEVGDIVVWLSGENVQHLEYAIDALNDAFDFKPVGFGGDLATTIAVNRTVTGEAEKIPKPCQLDAAIDGSDIDLSWVRRSRIGAYWSDNGDDEYETPLGESLEQYVVRIKDGPGGAILRTFTVNDATVKTYLAADITTDFGSMPDELTYDIRQVSGMGVVCPTREITVTL